MTKLELAMKIVVDDVKEAINDYYSDWEISSWSEMLEAFGQESKDFKEDVYYLLSSYSNDNNVDLFLNDEYELELEDGSFISYRKLSNLIRKELKEKVFN